MDTLLNTSTPICSRIFSFDPEEVFLKEDLRLTGSIWGRLLKFSSSICLFVFYSSRCLSYFSSILACSSIIYYWSALCLIIRASFSSLNLIDSRLLVSASDFLVCSAYNISLTLCCSAASLDFYSLIMSILFYFVWPPSFSTSACDLSRSFCSSSKNLSLRSSLSWATFISIS